MQLSSSMRSSSSSLICGKRCGAFRELWDEDRTARYVVSMNAKLRGPLFA